MGQINKSDLITAVKREVIEEKVYLIFFIHTQSRSVVFLEEKANIDAICYDKNPKLPGTLNPILAKQYKTVSEAKDDIFKLRYHHREFLKVKTGIKSMPKTLPKKLLGSTQVIDYTFLELDSAEN